MSVKLSLLALLDVGASYGYQLKSEFETRTASTWPLNIGQVYTTLDRLERDGLVERVGEDAEGRVGYAITDAGRAEVRRWFSSAVEVSAPARDELSIKFALAVTLPGVDVVELVQAQRRATLKLLQDLTRLRRTADDTAFKLLVESRIFHAEAEIRWLDHCEAIALRERRSTPVANLERAKERR